MSRLSVANKIIQLAVLLFLAGLTANAYGQRLEFTEDECLTVVYRGESNWLIENTPQLKIRYHDQLSAVKRIELLQHDISPEAISFWANFKEVKQIKIGELPDALSVSFEALKELRHLGAIESLDLTLSDVSDRELNFLRFMPQNLKRISVTCAFTGLSSAQNRRLGLTDSIGDVISKIGSLEELQIEGADFSDNFLASIAKLPRMKKLSLEGQFSARGLMHLGEMKTLTELKILGRQPWGPNVLTELNNTNLSAFDFAVESSFSHMNLVAEFRSLRHLRINGCSNLSEVQAFKNHPHLETISFVDKNCSFDIGELDVFLAMPHLESVAFSHGPVKEIRFRPRKKDKQNKSSGAPNKKRLSGTENETDTVKAESKQPE